MPDQRDLSAILLKHGYSGTKKIGEGSFGVAVLVEDADGAKGVCKVVDVSRASAKETQEARREGRLLSQVKHPYIVRYRENFAERGWLCIVMDFCDGGDLTAQIEAARKKREPLAELQILRWFTQGTLALKYLHGKHILHRDLKPSNIFLTKSGDIRLGDFGISKVMSCTAAFARTFVGTPYYLSPEVIQEKPYSWPSDIWSMGCILYQMCALKVPFDATNITGLAQKICKGPIPPAPSDYSDSVRELQLGMMERIASRRPKADDIINRPAIQSVVRAMLSEATSGKEKEKPKPKHEVMDQFQKFDQNGDGVIDRQELARVLKHLDARVWTDDSVGQIMLVADTNQDGRIQFDEFLQWIFGGTDGRKGISSRVEQLISLANLAVDHDDAEELLEHLLGWRQYVDMGCLRVLAPEMCVKTCEALASITMLAQGLLESANKRIAHDAARQVRAILQSVEQLVAESSRQHITRIGAASSRAALRTICLERVDGLRLGQCCGGSLSDSGAAAVGLAWDALRKGERIVEVRGHGVPTSKTGSRQPSPGPRRSGSGSSGVGSAVRGRSPEAAKDDLASSLTLCTSFGRQLDFGSKLASSQGAAFSFKAAEGLEVEQVLFNGKTCTGIRTAPIVVNWPQDKVIEVKNAFLTAVQAFWPLLLSLSFKMGPKYGNYALLEGRRLGLKEFGCARRRRDAAAGPTSIKPPGHWNLAAMGGEGLDGAPVRQVAEVTLKDAETARLQQLLSITFRAEKPSVEAPSLVAAPTGLELVRASRLQNWRSWSGYAARQNEIRDELAELKRDDRASASIVDPMTASHLDSLGIHLDPDANCRWLFHGISAEAATRVLDPDFDIDTAGAEDGMLYGRGIYLTEWCSQVDKTVLEGADGLRCMLLCRATLGNVLRDDAMLPDKVQLIHQCTGGEHHSVLGDREERSPGSSRDFVVYDKDQVYPEFLLWYRRAYE
eukprot:CAMPEP_0115417020 /NCGR_PEP_ID=MMETSP0271-20121206/23910_1 /TAXON_ID=71861 /ORGANISM="Scrippsiella trochoidea, Strain CCMP3099" /LENGTH=953 /DNA_ID=CAMNT_0002841397 /DNA_START=68 /DNA_END=2930 /DNA_ORIENTATION=+